MHDCVRRWHKQTGGRLLRMITGTQMALIACFGKKPVPLWLAKISPNPICDELLRQEYTALLYLKPWAESLGIPQVWDWEQSAQGTCLIQQGMPGKNPADFRLGGTALNQAIGWLETFQRMVPPAALFTMPDLILRDWDRSQREPDPFRLSGLLLEMLRQQSAPALPVTASHGDFWYGNILYADSGIRVVDWQCMGSRPPVEDLLTLLLKSEYRSSLAGRGDLESFLQFWHAPWIAACWRHYLAQLGWTEAAGKLGFYLYLARRIRWESGMEGQFRSPAERLAANMRWSGIVEWLAARRFPMPFTTRS